MWHFKHAKLSVNRWRPERSSSVSQLENRGFSVCSRAAHIICHSVCSCCCAFSLDICLSHNDHLVDATSIFSYHSTRVVSGMAAFSCVVFLTLTSAILSHWIPPCIFSSLTFYLFILCVHLQGVGTHMPWCTCGSQKTVCSSWFSLSTMWVMWLKLRLSGLPAEAFTSFSHPPGPSINFF